MRTVTVVYHSTKWSFSCAANFILWGMVANCVRSDVPFIVILYLSTSIALCWSRNLEDVLHILYAGKTTLQVNQIHVGNITLCCRENLQLTNVQYTHQVNNTQHKVAFATWRDQRRLKMLTFNFMRPNPCFQLLFHFIKHFYFSFVLVQFLVNINNE